MPHENQNSSEELLIRKAIAGDKEAFGRLYEMYADPIFSYLVFRVGVRSEAADMTETVFLKAWEHLPAFGKPGHKLNFRAWLYRIAHNIMVDYHRSAKDEVALEAVAEQADKQPRVHRLIEDAEQYHAIRQALQELDDLSRQVIILRFLSGLGSKETARILGISNANVRVIQYRALKKMRTVMGVEDE